MDLYPCLWQILEKNLLHEAWKTHHQHPLETSLPSCGKLEALADCIYCNCCPKQTALRSLCHFPKLETAYCNKEGEHQIPSSYLEIFCSIFLFKNRDKFSPKHQNWSKKIMLECHPKTHKFSPEMKEPEITPLQELFKRIMITWNLDPLGQVNNFTFRQRTRNSSTNFWILFKIEFDQKINE